MENRYLYWIAPVPNWYQPLLAPALAQAGGSEQNLKTCTTNAPSNDNSKWIWKAPLRAETLTSDGTSTPDSEGGTFFVARAN